MRYQGPRDFAVADPARLQRDLQALAQEVDRLFRAQQDGNPRRWAVAPALRAAGALAVNTITPVDGNVELTLPAWSPAIIGLECAIQRLSATGSVSVKAPPAPLTLNGASTSVALSSAARIYVAVAVPQGWSLWNDA